MFCPSCGTETSDQTKFCTKCGTNLMPVKDAMAKVESGATGIQQGQSWMEFQKELAAHAVGYKKKTPEEKRLTEIKGGVIVSSVGLGLLAFLSFLFNAIAQTIDGPEREIILALRFVGIIPFLIGIGIIVNGLFISKQIVEVKRQREMEETEKQSRIFHALETGPVQQLKEAYKTPASNFSVTETTTTKLREPAQFSGPGDT